MQFTSCIILYPSQPVRYLCARVTLVRMDTRDVTKYVRALLRTEL